MECRKGGRGEARDVEWGQTTRGLECRAKARASHLTVAGDSFRQTTGPDQLRSLRGLIWNERWFGKGRDYQGKTGKKAQKKNYWKTAVQIK